MQKREADITASVNKWFSKVVPTSSPWEIKHTRGNLKFYHRELKEHQRDWLYACTTPTGATWKIPDTTLTHPPFDVMHYKNTPAYVIIVFFTNVVAIEIRDMLKHMEKNKSILEEKRAVEIATYATLKQTLPK